MLSACLAGVECTYKAEGKTRPWAVSLVAQGRAVLVATCWTDARSGATLAVLKARSPACGCGAIYDGSFCEVLRPGNGVAAAALKREGLTTINDEEIES